MTSEDAMAKKKTAKKPEARLNYYRRAGMSVINVGLTEDERAEVQTAADAVGAKIAPFLKAAALRAIRETRKK